MIQYGTVLVPNLPLRADVGLLLGTQTTEIQATESVEAQVKHLSDLTWRKIDNFGNLGNLGNLGNPPSRCKNICDPAGLCSTAAFGLELCQALLKIRMKYSQRASQFQHIAT